MNTFRWGIIGTAGIVRKNRKAIRNSGSGVVNGVASRDAARRRQYVAECQAAQSVRTRTPRAGRLRGTPGVRDVDVV